MPTITLRNPHSVLAALESRPDDVKEIILPARVSTDYWAQVEKKARALGGRISAGASGPKGHQNPRDRGSRGGPPPTPGEGGRTSVAEALVAEREGLTADELFADAPTRAGGKGLWIALDSLQDPHNVGAIFRAAAFFGVEGILLTSERSAPLTGTVYDVA
ncbi:MAG: TrmH family RNA methyltransferase, partial [Bdellovibrionota bacterium]